MKLVAVLLATSIGLWIQSATSNAAVVGVIEPPSSNATLAIYGLSTDGSVATGEVCSTNCRAVRWTIEDGLTELLLPGHSYSYLGLVTADGSVVTGTSCPSSGTDCLGFRWTSATSSQPFQPPGTSTTVLIGVNANGSRLAGIANLFGRKSYVWDETIGYTPIESHDEFGETIALQLSADGSTVVGMSNASGTPATARAFVWNSSGTQFVDPLPGYNFGRLTLTTTDGSVAAGISEVPSLGGDGTQAMIWSESSGTAAIPFLPGRTIAHPIAISSDGSAVVGFTLGGGLAMGSFVWTQQSGTTEFSVPDQLDSLLFGISDDGQTVVGRANTSTGQHAIVGSPDGTGMSLTASGDMNSNVNYWLPDSATVLGQTCATFNSCRAFLWTPISGMTTIETPPEYSENIPRFLSADGTVVAGQLCDASFVACDGYVWTFSEGYTILQPLSGDVFSRATAMTQDGQRLAVESCTTEGICRVFVWSRTTEADSTPPVVEAVVDGTPGNGGWYTSDVHLTWQVSDPESPVSNQTPGCNTFSRVTDTKGISRTCTATSDGGMTVATFTIKRDTVPPTAKAKATPGDNAAGWRKVPVTVTFTGTDKTSKGVTCDSPIDLGEGASRTASGYCYDAAGHQSALATTSGISVDSTAPGVSIVVPTPGATYSKGQAVNASFTCSDALSGITKCDGTVDNGQPLKTGSKGTKQLKVTAKDAAGNVTEQTVTYTVN